MKYADLQVRDELEHLLDDDEDMAEMYLTEKIAQQLEDSSASSMNDDDMDNQVLQPDMDDKYVILRSISSCCLLFIRSLP